MKRMCLIFLVLILSASMFLMCGPSLQDEQEDMVLVNGGTFVQVDAENSTKNFSHTISSFYIGKYEVTYALWISVIKWNKHESKGYTFGKPGEEGNNSEPIFSARFEPVTHIRWRDAIVWCNAYSEKSGFTPVYVDSEGKTLKSSEDYNKIACDGAKIRKNANGYRLPTEGEWQYAASNRGSTPCDYASGATDDHYSPSACEKVAWYKDNSDLGTHSIGGKSPNGLGLHDMSGNVWEWCWDKYADYPDGDQTDYENSSIGFGRVARGGDYYSDSEELQVGYRDYHLAEQTYNDVGFRLARHP